MTAQTKKQQLKEIEYQIKMLNNLKKWMRNLIILSSVGIVLAYWALKLQQGRLFQVIGFVSIILIVVCVIFCAVIGLGYKKGKGNVDKILHVLENSK